MALTEKLTAVADAIRDKTGKTDGLTLDQMAAEIAWIEAGDGGIQLLTGSFTPAEATSSITLEFDKPISNALIVQSVPTLNLGYSVHYVSCHIPGFAEFYAHSNLNGTTWANTTPGNSCITIANNGMSLTATTNRNWGAVEHKWIAW